MSNTLNSENNLSFFVKKKIEIHILIDYTHSEETNLYQILTINFETPMSFSLKRCNAKILVSSSP